jgi:hypothetical protein
VKSPKEKIPKEALSGVDLLDRDIGGELDTDISEQKDIYDKEYVESNKRHQNLLSKCNYIFVIVSRIIFHFFYKIYYRVI